jgi:hypothetical protein
MTLVTGIPAEDPTLSVTDDVDIPAGLDTILDDVATVYAAANGYRTAQDNFTRADSATTLGTASDGGAWTVDGFALFGITGNKAYLASGSTSPAPMARREVGQNIALYGGDAVANEVTSTSPGPPTPEPHTFGSHTTRPLTRVTTSSTTAVTRCSVFKHNAGSPTQIGSTITCTDWASTGTPTELRVFYDGSE